jgi:quaternary ammonium compound-resistance protein SugE
MAWLLVAVAALLEVVWALALKEAAGFERPGFAALGIAVATASLLLLMLALRTLPVGTAYALWTGLGALGVALAGIVALGEGASLARLASLALIVAGVAGLRLAEG